MAPRAIEATGGWLGWLGGSGAVALIVLAISLMRPSCQATYATGDDLRASLHEHDSAATAHADLRIDLARQLTSLEGQVRGLRGDLQRIAPAAPPAPAPPTTP